MKHDLKKLIKEVLINHKPDCGCGCHGKCAKAPKLNENLEARINVTENMQYHINNKKPLTENTFRYGSDTFLDLWAEARYLYSRGAINLSGIDKEIVTESNLGEYGLFEGKKVPLDMPMEELDEVKDKKHPPLNKPHRGGPKKFYVYVRDPKTKNIKKVAFGAAGGGQNLAVKIRDPKARNAFAKRQHCADKKDKTKPGYWACHLPKYAKALGLKGSYSGYW
jgi:hypothetical protein